MAQVGRISGPLLFSNLERNGIDLAFRNDLSTTQLLYLDVNNNKITVNTATPIEDFTVDGKLQTTNLISNTSLTNNQLTIENSTISVAVGNLNLDAQEKISLSTADIGNFRINDNTISTLSNDDNIVFQTNGTGALELFKSLNVTGNLNATGNITFDGSITLGDDRNEDIVDFNTDVNSDIIPDQNNLYNLGTSGKRWDYLYTNLVNGQSVIADGLLVGSIEFTTRVGNIFYVSVNGDDTASGDHPQAPVQTIKRALELADASVYGPVVIKVYPGEYQEQLPLVVPSNVTIDGVDLRNCIVVPDTSSQSEDVFHLTGETTISNLTIKDFYYDSINDKGYAIRFAPNAITTSRSPYIQNVTVITQGTTTSASDPRGFDSGDAGKGALIDGASVDSNSVTASMLFHSCTFITPGVDAITMTNGVRVEWLNSFTYFANRGLYAVDGVTGHVSEDGSTVLYGAELRSIGSANVYGNYGAVADGNDCLMYLIQHNLAYIGTGKRTDNDPSRAIQTQEINELNNGRIYYQSIDHLGNFRVGDQFFVDLETGESSFNADDVTGADISQIILENNGDETIITKNLVQTGNIRLRNNDIDTIAGDLNFSPANNIINLENTNISKNLDISGNFSFDGSLNLLGNQATDTLAFNVEIEQDFNPHQDYEFDLGSQTKSWNQIHLSKLTLDNIEIQDNFITTTNSNSNLELRADNIGTISSPNNNVEISQDLTVSGNTSLQGTSVTGTVTQVGNKTQTGNLDILGEISNGNILIEDNFISVTNSNSDLELYASASGNINIDSNDVIISQDLTVQGNTNVQDITVTGTITHTGNRNQTGNLDIAGEISNGDVYIEDNFITTTNTNANLDLRANGTGEIFVPENNLNVTNNFNVLGFTNLKDTNIIGTLEQTGTVEFNSLQQEPFLFNVPTNSPEPYTYAFINRFDALFGADRHNINIFYKGVQIYSSGTFSGNGSLSEGQQFVGNDGYTYEIGPKQGDYGATFGLPDNDVDNVDEYFSVQRQDFLVPGGPTEVTFGTLDVSSITVSEASLFDDIQVEGNKLTTTLSSSNLNLQSAGTTVIFDDNLQGLSLDSIGTTTVANNATSIVPAQVQKINSNNEIEIFDNRINSNIAYTGNIELEANTTGIISLLSDSSLTQLDVLTNSTFTDINLTGDLTINGDVAQTGNRQVFGNGTTDSITTESDAEFEILNFYKNVIQANPGQNPIRLQASGTGNVIFYNNVSLGQRLDITENFNTKNLTANNLSGPEFNVVDNIKIRENFVTTSISNSNLELIAEQGRIIGFQESTNIGQSLTVNGNTNLLQTNIVGDIAHTGNGFSTNLDVSGNLTAENIILTGNTDLDSIRLGNSTIQTYVSNADLQLEASGTGAVTFTGLNITDLTVSGTITSNDIVVNNDIELDTIELSSDIKIFDNVITTTNSNSDLELRSLGPIKLQRYEFINANINFESRIELSATNDFIFENNGAIKIPVGTSLDSPIIYFFENSVDAGSSLDSFTDTVDGGNSIAVATDGEIGGGGSQIVGFLDSAGYIRFNSSLNLFEGVGDGYTKYFNGLYSSDARTSIQVHPVDNTISISTNNVVRGSIDSAGLNIHAVQIDDVNLNNNTISTNVTNSDLELRVDGSGELDIFDINLKSNVIKSTATDANIRISGTDESYIIFVGDKAVKFPSGDTSQRPLNPVIGQTRHNTDVDELEVWTGTEWKTAAGTFENISAEQMENEAFVQTLIYG